MLLWLIFALMTAAAIFAVLWPLSRSGAVQGGGDIAVYRDQLEEIARDEAAGQIAGAEAQAARVEVSRRLIAAGDAQAAIAAASPRATLWRRRAAAVVALVFVPFVGGTIYLLHGSPQLPGEPLASRERDLHENASIPALVAQVEAHLERDPKDARGWEVLAPIYLRLGRFDEAVKARRNVIEFGGDTPQRSADLGEALVADSNGIVTAEAKEAFEQALAREPADPKSRFYVGLAAQQDGDKPKASQTWRALLKDAPADAPWVKTVRQALASLGETEEPIGGAAGPSAADVAAATTMTEAQRGEMIRGMVAGLAERLSKDGSDINGWLRLVRAYVVLGERDKAVAAVGDARRALAGDVEKRRRLDDLAKDLGIDG